MVGIIEAHQMGNVYLVEFKGKTLRHGNFLNLIADIKVSNPLLCVHDVWGFTILCSLYLQVEVYYSS